MTAVVTAARVSAPVALPGFLLATVLITVVVSPLLLSALHAAGAEGATLEEVTLRTLELTAITLTFPLLAVLGGGGRAAWGYSRSDASQGAAVCGYEDYPRAGVQWFLSVSCSGTTANSGHPW